jgi:uncharacterized protein YbjT (DUF2867 family)
MKQDVDILLFGGTGHLGQDLLQTLLLMGFSIRVASRRARPAETPRALHWAEMDLATGRGLRESVRGARTIFFCAANPKNHAAVEVVGMRRLLEAAKSEGVSHFIFVSIVGIDHLPVPYYRTKREAERLIRESGVPSTILRATQFHYFVALLLSGLARVPFAMPVPRGFSVQPVATGDVAARLVHCVTDGPRGLLPDFCGPEIFSFTEAAARWKEARGLRKPILPVTIPGRIAAAFREGHNTNPAGELGSMRWSQWLAREYPQTRPNHDLRNQALLEHIFH